MIQYLYDCSFDVALNRIKKCISSEVLEDELIIKLKRYRYADYGDKDVIHQALYRDKNIAILDEIDNNSSQKSSIFICNWREHIFCLQSYLFEKQEFIQIGQYSKKYIPFFNQNKIESSKHSTLILLCQDMRTAIKLQKIINHSNNIDSVKELDIVVTSHLERDLSRYDWSFFYAKDVILLCALTLFDILNIEQYKIKFDENKVVNFRICTYFLLPYEKNILESIDNCKLTSVEEHLLTRTICIDRIQNVEDLISRIEDSALPYTSFLQWGYDIELFEKSSDDKENNNVEEQKIKFFDPHIDIDVLEPQLNDVSEVSMRELFPEGGFVFLIGPKDAGKSLMCFSIVDSLLNKKNF